jgi:hypothetical protein
MKPSISAAMITINRMRRRRFTVTTDFRGACLCSLAWWRCRSWQENERIGFDVARRRFLLPEGSRSDRFVPYDELVARGEDVRITDNLDPAFDRGRQAWIPVEAEFVELGTVDDGFSGALRDIHKRGVAIRAI